MRAYPAHASRCSCRAGGTGALTSGPQSAELPGDGDNEQASVGGAGRVAWPGASMPDMAGPSAIGVGRVTRLGGGHWLTVVIICNCGVVAGGAALFDGLLEFVSFLRRWFRTRPRGAAPVLVRGLRPSLRTGRSGRPLRPDIGPGRRLTRTQFSAGCRARWLRADSAGPARVSFRRIWWRWSRRCRSGRRRHRSWRRRRPGWWCRPQCRWTC